MKIQRIVSEGLAHNSYFVSDGQEALVIDPRRDIDIYLKLAGEYEAKIVAVLETHRQEDFVLGSSELSRATGAEVYHGEGIPYTYGVKIGEGFEISLGRSRLKALSTPGHTPESMTYVLHDLDANSAPVIAFTGDALFVGDVGRIDLPVGINKTTLAEMLYDSLFKKILPLGDGVLIAPAHGGGSVCGGAISERVESSIGIEKLTNRFLQMEKPDFMRQKVSQTWVVPSYFHKMEDWNLRGAPVLERPVYAEPLPIKQFQQIVNMGHVAVVDVRMPQAFAGGHIPQSYNIWLQGLAMYAGWILPDQKPLVLVLDNPSDLDTAMRSLFRVGFDNIRGYLVGGFESWQNAGLPVESLSSVGAQEARGLWADRNALILDVRNPAEWQEGFIEGSLLMHCAEIERNLENIPKDMQIVTMCGVGHRGALAASLLQKNGYNNVKNFLGGFSAWNALGFPVTFDRSQARFETGDLDMRPRK